MSRVVGAYSATLQLYPRGFRREYGGDLVSLAEELVLDLGGRRAAVRLARDLLTSLPARYLEVLVKRPAPLVLPVLAGLAAVTLLVLAAVLGTAVGVAPLLLAMLAATVAVLVFPQARVVQEPARSKRWWQLVLLGLLLHGALILGQQITGAESLGVWLLAVAAVIGGWTCIAAGLLLGVVHLVSRRHAATS